MSAAEALLGRIVDYAGLFPPAALPMDSAVKNYQQSMNGDESWMLGNFVLPAARLTEFAAPFEAVCCGEQEAPWTLSVICAAEEDASAIEAFHQGAVFIGSIETKASDAAAANELLSRLPAARARFVEFPLEKTAELLPVLARLQARAKMRMGGTTAETIPSIATVAHFLAECAKHKVPWKATAGLHHAVRSVRELTPGGVRVKMHGFLNLFLAGALAFYGADETTLANTLSEEDAAAFQLDDDVIRWHDNVLITDQIEQARSEFAISFGSCSFEEPVEDLRAMGWL